MITFSNESHHFEKATFSIRYLNVKILQREANLDPPNKGPEGKEVILELCSPTEIDMAKKKQRHSSPRVFPFLGLRWLMFQTQA